MRRKRIKPGNGAYYHLVSRCALKQYLLDDTEKQVFVGMLRRTAEFSGIEVLTYCVMSNHFHLLVRVPSPRQLTEGELLSRVAILYGNERAKDMRARWDSYQKSKRIELLEAEKAQLSRRMYDISPFMQSLKQRFTVWYRANHKDHEGTLWQSRFSSTLVEGSGSLAAVAAYIDLNPIRAGIVSNPKDYAFSGYGAASAGDSDARKGLSGVYGNLTDNYEKVIRAYRGLLYAKGAADLDPDTVRKVLANHEKPSLPQLLRCKIRAMSNGLAIGSKAFAGGIFATHRYAFSENRRHPPLGAPLCPEWDGIQLCSVRKLRKDAITSPA
jgi:REP element-mobilizing transposase RayT